MKSTVDTIVQKMTFSVIPKIFLCFKVRVGLQLGLESRFKLELGLGVGLAENVK